MSGRPTEGRYCRYPAPMGRCHGNLFLAFYIWAAHLHHLANRTEPYAAAMRPYVKLLRPLVVYFTVSNYVSR